MLVGWPIRVSWNREPNKDPGTITDFFQQVTKFLLGTGSVFFGHL
jgi:hypothetical protein